METSCSNISNVDCHISSQSQIKNVHKYLVQVLSGERTRAIMALLFQSIVGFTCRNWLQTGRTLGVGSFVFVSLGHWHQTVLAYNSRGAYRSSFPREMQRVACAINCLNKDENVGK